MNTGSGQRYLPTRRKRKEDGAICSQTIKQRDGNKQRKREEALK
jgi:hypothetical protein